MKKVLFATMLMMLTGSLLLTGCGGGGGDTVATVGSETVSVQTLVDDMVRAYRNPENARKQTLETRLNILQSMITTRLKKLEASELGLRELPEMQEKAQSYLDGEAMNRLYELEIIDVIASDEAIADYYEHDTKEVKASHILLHWPESTEERDSADVRRRADEIYQLALQTESFGALAAEHTEEPGGADREGDLGWFGWGRMTPVFQEAVWEMNPGNISQPVETRFGIHIIHLEEVRKKSLPPLEDMRDDIQRSLMQLKRQEISERVDAYFIELRETYQFSFTDKIDELLPLVSAVETEGNPFTTLDADTKTWVVGTSTAGDITVADLEQKIDERPRPGISFPDRPALEELVDGVAIPMLLVERAKEKGLLEDEEVIAAAELSLARDLERELTRQQVDDRINITEEMLQQHHADHGDLFVHKATVEVREIFVSDEDLAKQLVARARAGESFVRLAREYTERSSARENDGLLPPFPVGRYGKMGEAAFALAVGEITGPIALGSKFSVIKLEDRTEETPKTFEEAERQVRSALEQELREQAQQELMGRLLEKYPVVVDTERVRTLFM